MNILFIGQSHRITDPRLRYREMSAIKARYNEAEFFFLQYKKRALVDTLQLNGDVFATKEVVSGLEVNYLQVVDDRSQMDALLGIVSTKFTRIIARFVKEHLAGKRISLIQASDVRELAIGVQLQQELQCPLIYDSHEDYVRQALDYGKGSFKAYIWAALFMVAELRFLRHCRSIFCTDEFLVEKYGKRFYKAGSVNLLRNFPYLPDNGFVSRNSYRPTDRLRLVYIGGINKYRGLVEASRFVQEFNQRNSLRQLCLTIYGPTNELTKHLVSGFGVTHYDWIDYDNLMECLAEYDVGLCLWLPIKKFHRNLPLKNFDYMSVGLPFITSNFGNLKKYVEASGGGVCINPTSYDDFESAVEMLFDPKVREKLGKSGAEWARLEGNFVHEAQEYLEMFAGLQGTQGRLGLEGCAA